MSGYPADTIAAIATARGRAALAIVRVSGPSAVAVVDACFPAKELLTVPSHTAHVGFFTARDGGRIDQVVVTLFLAPRSATGEDVVEVSCHGGDFAATQILQSLLDHGARLAEPGEFTQRAFLNGKLDLAQAESVAELIHARSSLAHRVSLAHLQGRYSDLLQRLRDELLDLCALIELELDFAEEDVEFANKARLESLLQEADSLLSTLLGSYRVGELIRDGVRVVISGRPNAGKSTLLNALVGRDRAIVSAIPGTTRDEIEAETEIDGLLFRFVDTAGLRESQDVIEAEGVRRAQRSIGRADSLLYVFDGAVGLADEERTFLQRVQAEQPQLAIVLVANKADLVVKADIPAFDDLPIVALSALAGCADEALLYPLLQTLRRAVQADLSDADGSAVVMNQRHRQHLRRALDAVRAAQQVFLLDGSGDTLAIDLRVALHELGAITGEITTEDVLGQIFSRFCIGK